MSPRLDAAVPFALPLRRRFRGTEVREGVLVRMGATWGEWAPFPEYDDITAVRWLRGALEAASGDFPAPHRASVAVNAIVPALPAEVAYTMVLDGVAEDGTTTVKVKVAERGCAFAEDVARVAAVRAALDDAGASEGRIRVDVNAAWTLDEAVERLDVLDDIAGGLEYAEQPCAELRDLADLRLRTSVRIAVDEGVRLRADHDPGFVELVRAAADVLVLKAIPSGGVRRAVGLAEEIGLPVTVSGSLDSTVGLWSGLALAAALPDEPYPCGLGTGRLLGADLTSRTALPVDGRLSVVRHDPDPDALAAASARLGTGRASWWLERLQRCLAALDEVPPS
jgi:o-succinylbenzoate synthase